MKTNVHRLYAGQLARPLPAIGIQILTLVSVVIATRSVRAGGMLRAGLAFGGGLAAWTLFEYVLHRWIMHSRNRKLWELLHQEHHQMREMMDPEHRLLHPLVPSFLFGGITFALSLFGAALALAMAGFWIGYLVYEAIHWAHHDARLTRALSRTRYFRQRHGIHHDHHVRPRVNFGFTSAFWDHAFGTYLDPDEVSDRAPRRAERRCDIEVSRA